MGREIRRVPANWEHPRYTSFDAPYPNHIGSYRPMRDESFRTAMAEWWEEYQRWERGERPDYFPEERYPDGIEFWEWHGGPPDPAYYRPDWNEEEATWWQVYETVSEGTPITPPFATPEELIEYLSTCKDFWGYGPVSRESAERFVSGGWAPSAIINQTTGELRTGIEALDFGA